MHSSNLDLCHSIIWAWAEDKNIWVIASYTPGKENHNAGAESCKNQTELEWMLNQKLFAKFVFKFRFQSEVNLFASRFNAQLPVFVSYHPDPEAKLINAFSISWHDRPFYAYPPFAVTGKVLT